MDDKSLKTIYLPLKITFGLVPLIAGADKFTNLLTDWDAYLSPLLAGALPFSPEVFMRIAGIIEMVVGLAILTKFTRLGANIASVWLVLIAFNLIAAGILDVAVRDLVMAVSAFTLGQAAALRGEAWLPSATQQGEIRNAAHS